MAFSDQLGADNDLKLAGSDGLDLAPQAFRPAGHIGGEHENAGIGEGFSDFLVQSLDARTAGGQAFDGLASGTIIRPALHMATMMAHQSPPKAVLDEPTCAIGALKAVAAMAA